MTLDRSLGRELAPTGRLRAALNMANAVLAHSHTARVKPAGVTIDLARALASELGIEVELLPFGAPGECVEALADDRADIGFLAVDPQRAEQVRFTAPYLQIEGCFLAREGSPWRHADEVDRADTDIFVIERSAYDLHLTRHLQQARLVRLPDATRVLAAFQQSRGAAVVAGVKQAMLEDAARTPGLRLLPGRFMVISQCMVLRKTSSELVQTAVESFLQHKVRSGFVAESLRRHGIEGATIVDA